MPARRPNSKRFRLMVAEFVHHGGIVFARENVSCATHVRGELIGPR